MLFFEIQWELEKNFIFTFRSLYAKRITNFYLSVFFIFFWCYSLVLLASCMIFFLYRILITCVEFCISVYFVINELFQRIRYRALHTHKLWCVSYKGTWRWKKRFLLVFIASWKKLCTESNDIHDGKIFFSLSGPHMQNTLRIYYSFFLRVNEIF